MTDLPRIALIGFGEAAMAFRGGWPGDARVAAFDVKTANPATASVMAERYRTQRVDGAAGLGSALAGAGLVLSLVTADRALEAAEAAAAHLAPGALYLDGNSCAPGTKRRASALIEGAGAAYIDMAIMAPVAPRRHRTPVLLAGAEADRAAALLDALGMVPSVAGPRIGDASSIKMIRSVMIKGLEALTAECLLAARRAGVEEPVLASLAASDPQMDWRGRGAYNLERMMVHGTRRAAEMREVAATLRDLGLPDRMAAASAAWQEEIGAACLPAGEDDLAARADRILGVL